MTDQLDKPFDPKAIESEWYAKWEKLNYFAPSGKGEPYCIMLPPPNVTGVLHMGHGFQHTLMDALIRYHRMCGHNTLWQPGTDHAGIATQLVVERQLEAEGTDRKTLGREAFIKRVWEWKETSGNTIEQQMRRLGTSPDWTRSRFTMDDGLSAAVQKVFIDLYKQDLIYRGTRLVNWDPGFKSAISDLEVDNQEKQGHLWHFQYPLADGSGHVTVATTRPETLLGDTAVAVHPDDERYQSLIGQQVKLPLTDRLVPIVADDYVDATFGSGCVKITPAHDFNDYELGQRHQLEQINVFNDDMTINDNMPEAYRGLDRFAARKQIVKDMDEQGLLERVEDYTTMVPISERSGEIVEPYLTPQWFVRAGPLAEPALEAVETDQIEFIPAQWKNTYREWMTNIQDWCISRQLWWGHRIPAWFDADGNVYVGENEADVRRQHNLGEQPLTQETDVLDTWFSSALWPFSTLGWPQDTDALKTFYPTQVIVTGFDIIFFWIARMIMMGLHFTKQIPFERVYFHGMIRDEHGKKMSKSKGNVLDPLDLIDGIELEALVEKRTAHLMQPNMRKKIERATRKQFPDGMEAYGADALRFTFCALASQGRDIRFDIQRIAGYRNFANKLWNASRFVLQNTEDFQVKQAQELGPAEHWINHKLTQLINRTHQHYDRYRFDLMAKELHHFIWSEFCDWYLELAKVTLNDAQATPAQKQGTQFTLLNVLEQCLRLLHPIMPFVTESLWQTVSPRLSPRLNQQDSVAMCSYPKVQPEAEADHAAFDWMQTVVTAIRQIRGEMNIPPKRAVPLLLQQLSSVDQSHLKAVQPFVKALANIESTTLLDDNAEAPPTALGLAGDLKVMIPLAGLIDPVAEQKRLDKLRGKRTNELQQVENKLKNKRFVENAPADIVQTERERIVALQSQIENLDAQMSRLHEILP